jgi:hypothetical protein
MAAELSNQIDWDGQALYIEAATDVGPVTCKVPRDTIHIIRLYSDAIGREIYLERHRIVQKLAPFLRAKLPFAEAGQMIELFPCDVED